MMMGWQWTPYTLPFVATGLASLMMAVYIGRQRSLPVVKSKQMLLVVGAIWIFGYVLELIVPVAEPVRFGTWMQIVGLVSAPVAFLFYAARHSGKDRWMSARNLLGVAIVPVLTVLLMVTNDFHRLMLTDWVPATNGQFVYVVKHWGPAYWCFVAYASLIMFIAIGLLVRNSLLSRNMFVWQTVSFVVGSVVAMVLGLLDAFGIYLIPGLQLSAFAVNLLSVTIGAYLIPLRRREARTASYSAAFNNLLDPIIVVDPRGEILDLNAAARQWLLPQAPRGAHVALPELPVELNAVIANLVDDPLVKREVTLTQGGEGLTYEIKASPLKDAGDRVISNILIFHDVTERVREIRERREAEAQIQASLVEKEVLLKEIHHRVKNNLQVISSLLALQARQVVSNPEAEAALHDSQQRVRSMALIHEKLYQSQNLAEINLADYIRHLAASMVRSYQGSVEVDLRLALETVALGVDQAVPCGLILNELITNALKYAFPEGRHGTLWIDLDGRTDGKVRLRVADDGPGLPPHLDIRQTPSLGLQLVNSLVVQLQGTLEVARVDGTEFRIAFPYHLA
jgi:two-component sensor histidine kinase